MSLLPIPARRAPPTSPTARTHPWQKAALVVQRVVRGFFSRKGLMTMITSRTAAAITIQRMQRGHAAHGVREHGQLGACPSVSARQRA